MPAARSPVALLLLALLPLLGSALSGCAGFSQPAVLDRAAANSHWAQRQEQLGSVQGFEARGRIAVKGGGLSGALHWLQAGEQFRLRIAGPFGAGALLIEGLPSRVMIKNKDIELETTEPQRVLLERTGWPLPLDALRWWVLGIPAPGEAMPAAQIDALGRPTELRQRGWLLRYGDYREAKATALPGRIEASLGEWSATVIVEELRLAP